jgi:hypothetical protein
MQLAKLEMRMPRDYHQYYLDASYEVWRSGGNSDRLSYDRVYSHMDNGLRPEEAAASEMRRWREQRYQASQAEEDYAQAQEYYAQQDEKRWADLERGMALDAEYGPVILAQE